MENAKDLIVNTALELLAKHEKLQSPERFVTADEVAACMRIYKRRDMAVEYVAKVLDSEFASKFNGKRVVYLKRHKKKKSLHSEQNYTKLRSEGN